MLYYLATLLVSDLKLLNIFKYITFRGGCAIATSLFLSFVFGSFVINKLKCFQKNGQPIRADGPPSHITNKKGTPTMGGLLIIGTTITSTLLWSDLSNPYIWIVLFILVSHAVLGFADDMIKILRQSSEGLKARTKILWQLIFSATAVYLIYCFAGSNATSIAVPFLKDTFIDLGYLYFLFGIIVIIGASNAVNLTDGLDGLAIGPIAIAISCFALISYLVGNVIFANYLQIYYVFGAGELAVLCSAIVGSSLGFLWYNAPPARIFMGDVGSLALGAVLGTISVITKHEIVLFFTGGLFVIEALSVMLQVTSFKMRKKRIFRMAPVHHHFEKLGWSETTIVMRFWVIAVIFALIGLSTLKLR